MAARPQVSVARIRKAVRDVLNMQEGEPLAEEPMLDAVRELVGRSVDLTQLRDAIEWNHSEAYVDRKSVV